MITLKTLAEATPQQVFDQVATHLLKQNAKSMSTKKEIKSGAGCSYRGDDGMMCAAGCLIADDEYKLEMDTANNTSWGYLIDLGMVPLAYAGLIQDLQGVHDETHAVYWKEGLKTVATEHGLSTVILDRIKAAL